MEALNTSAVKLLHLLGREDVRKVDTTIGSEQEYFLIDKDLYKKRKDLLFCGRTLIGAPAPKGQMCIRDRSSTAPIMSPSENRIEAGPSHGSIIVA